jgi:hypothetical protein
VIPSQHIFDRIVADQSQNPILENNLRGIFAEYLVADLLGPEWSVRPGSWNSWDVDGPKGERIEVKSSAYLQTWTEEYLKRDGYKPSPPSFDIAERAFDYWGEPLPSPTRQAHAYVFALHAERDAGIADQRRSEQWQFFVVATARLPVGQRRIGLTSLAKLTEPVSAVGLRAIVLSVIGSSGDQQ